MAMLSGAWPFLLAQSPVDTITEVRVLETMNVLAGDSLQGRGNGSTDLLKAATFINSQFQEAGLQPLPGSASLFHPFNPFKEEKDSLKTEYNIVGVIPGRSKPEEYIVFSAHYDHEGLLRGKKKDRIMNGANDNASGTTALLMLARYFALRKDNERTLVFCAFAGEEIGLKGSRNLVQTFNTEKIKAGINLEMLGVPQYGKKRVFIIGEKYSTLPDLLGKRLKAEGLKVIREPDEEKMLFMRSDNYPFVEKDAVFHTIMASDDDEPCYHKPCDEIKRIDISNLTFIIRAIAAGTRSLISGDETPDRVSKPD
jgi:hypothetical protein